MCDFQARLVGWMDQEVWPDDALEIERHLEGCEDCRRLLAGCEQVMEHFAVYCDAIAAQKNCGAAARRMPVLLGAMVAATVIWLALPRTPVDPPRIPASTTAVASAALLRAESAPRKMIRRRQLSPPVGKSAAKWQPVETAVQIAIPAEAMFPPGALPEGIHFVAELNMAADGSAERLRLWQ